MKTKKLLPLLLLLALPAVAQANLTVTNLADNGPGTLRQAIADAAPGDTINFAVTGTITLTNGQLVITNNITIAGPGAASLTISGNNASRVLLVTNGTVATISSLTIANGRAPTNSSGGGILNSGALTVNNCTISNCYANLGGGLRNLYGTVLLDSCSIVSNSASLGSVPSGGGLMNYGGMVTLRHSKLSGNNAQTIGGAIWNYQSSVMVIEDSLLSGNSAANGGALRNEGSLTITNSTISGNSGAVGGGIDNLTGTLTLDGCTITANSVTNAGGGISNHGGSFIPYYPAATLNLYNSIVAGNSATSIGPDCNGRINSLDFNLVQNTNGCVITNLTVHNIYNQDPMLGPLANNGGPTPTHALLLGSPAIDRGSSGGLTTDQRGQPRPFRFPLLIAPGDGSDIGAYELQERAQTNWVVNESSSNLLYIVNSTNDVDDGVPGIAHCSLREAINAANAVTGTNMTTINFATNVPGISTAVTGTITLTNGQLSITKAVKVIGLGATNLTVSGNNSSRIFSFNNANAIVSGLTIANGKILNGDGGGLNNNGGSLMVSNCIISSNFCAVGALGQGGGGIFNFGVCEVVNSIFIRNSSSVYGAAILSSGGMLTLKSSTVSSNAAGWYGGGIAVLGNSTNVILNSTVTGNTAVQGGGLYDGSFIGLHVHNTIVAWNAASQTGGDCYSIITSDDYNLIQNTNGCTVTNLTAHNIYNQDPKLGPLAYLGGPTPTHPLRYDSPALNAGSSGGLTTDQRGFPRPLGTAAVSGGDGSDIGAYEADPNLRILSIQPSGSDVLVNYNTLFGRVYQVHGKNSLTGSWTVLATNLAGTGGIMQCVDTNGADQPERFYRAAQMP